MILSHNHPSGVAEPSQADELITQRLREALGLIDVRVLDHLIVAGSTVTSMAERGVDDPRLLEGIALIARNATQSLLRCGPASTSVCRRSPGATAR